MKVCKNNQWFNIHAPESEHNELDYDEFMNTIKTKTTENVTRTKYFKNYKIDYIDIFSDERFNDMIKQQDVMQEYTPIITFHATQSIDKINSIKKYGYLLPNTLHPMTGQKMTIANGNVYGEGIYSTLDISFAQWFNFTDLKHSVYLIVNVVLPVENVSVINRSCFESGKPPHSHIVSKTYCTVFENYTCQSKIHKHVQKVQKIVCRNPCCPDIEGVIDRHVWCKHLDWRCPYYDCFYGYFSDFHWIIDEKYSNGSFTRYVPENKIVVSASPKYIYPVMILKLDKNVVKTPLLTDNYKIYVSKPGRSSNVHKIVDLDVTKYVDKYLPIIYFNRVVNDIYVVELPFITSVTDIVHHICVPSTLLRKSDTIKTLSSFCNSLESDRICRIYDKCVYKSEYNTSTFVTHLQQNITGKKCDVMNLMDKMFDEITDGNQSKINIIYLFVDNPDNTDCTDLFEKYKMFIAKHRIIIKVIFHGDISEVDKSNVWQIKSALQTEYPFENLSLECTNFNTCLDNILCEIENIETNANMKFSIPYPYGTFGEGFVTSFQDIPVWDIQECNYFVYRGSDIHTVRIDGILHRTKFREITESDNKVECFTGVVKLLSRFRNSIICHPRQIHNYKNMLTIVYAEMLKVLDKIGESKQLTTIYHQLSQLFTEFKTLSNVDFTGEWFDRLLKMKFSNAIVSRSRKINVCDISKLKNSGIGLNVFKQSCSEVEPWLLYIKYVSTNKFEIYDLYEKTTLDCNNKMITDVLPDLTVNDCYYAYIFTRNPHLYIPSQKIALYVTTWTTLITQSFRTKNIEHVKIADSMIPDIINMYKNHSVNDIIKNINSTKSVEETAIFYTTVHNVQSINCILGALLQKDVYDSIRSIKDLVRYAFAESIMRSCRAFCKITKKTNYEHILDVLGINETTDLATYTFDIIAAAKKTYKFYKISNTNCDPFTFVAVTGFIKNYHDGNSLDEFKNVTMKSFLNTYFEDLDGYEVQVALFLQGMHYNSANSRKDLNLDTQKLLHDLINYYKNYMSIKQKIQHDKINYKNRKIQRQIELASPYIMYHSVANVFNYATIGQLNYSRPLNDQLEITPSGMLKHHCSCPNCPMYLVNFATEADIVNGTRHGLFNHLKYDRVNNLHVPSFHLMAKQFSKNTTFEIFCNKMNNHFKNSKIWTQMNNKDEKLKRAWNFYN